MHLNPQAQIRLVGTKWRASSWLCGPLAQGCLLPSPSLCTQLTSWFRWLSTLSLQLMGSGLRCLQALDRERRGTRRPEFGWVNRALASCWKGWGSGSCIKGSPKGCHSGWIFSFQPHFSVLGQAQLFPFLYASSDLASIYSKHSLLHPPFNISSK